MGTSYSGSGEMDIIPRSVYDIFKYIENDQKTDYNSNFIKINSNVSFMELYQENLYDLLSDKPRDQCVMDIREDGNKGVKIPELTEILVKNVNVTLKCLIEGLSGRATGATAMNAQSSRSHAKFTITIYMDDNTTTITSKFHLVDLAGSERSKKKTKAIGERFKEGVNINIGLLALGNVISALGDGQKYISYRDSKLTRLLQDSLGGNSITLMIACVSPADYNCEETLSTLRYADRARKIKNKPVVNQDSHAAEIARLRQIINQLRCERMVDGTCTANGTLVNSAEIERCQKQISTQQEKINSLTLALTNALAENANLQDKVHTMQLIGDESKDHLSQMEKELNDILELVKGGDECLHNKLQKVSEILANINASNKQFEEELMKRDLQDMSAQSSTSFGGSGDASPDILEKQERYATEQMSLHNELKELNRDLAIKEQLALQILANTHHWATVDIDAMEVNKAKVSALEAERDELMQQLKSAHTSAITSKLSEQRRVRVKELEHQISELNRKVQEQARMIKLREKDEARIKTLQSEIQGLKVTKVKLIKSMRTEEQRFREWRVQREKELVRLKDQDRKRQNQMLRMETMHMKQQNVLKRKIEEAAAINKRLKDALMLQKQAQERRLMQTGNKASRIEQWIEQEYEVMISTLEAEHTKEQLIEDRKELTQQLDVIKADNDFANSEEGQRHVKDLQVHIDMRNAQIQDLNQKILDSDQDSKTTTRFEAISSMMDAKLALRKLFDLTANARKKSLYGEFKINELNAALDDAQTKLKNCENQLKETTVEQKYRIDEITRQYEEKISLILKTLHNSENENVNNELLSQLKHLLAPKDNTDDLRHLVEQYRSQIETLKTELNEINQKKQRKNKVTPPPVYEIAELEDSLVNSEEIVDDDTDTDPDWRKTPLYKRITAVQQHRPKRSSGDGEGCTCKTNCKTKLCGCKKRGNICSERCNCPSENCVNRDSEQVTRLNRKIFESDDSEDSFKRPLSEVNGEEVNRKKKKTSYFSTPTTSE